MKRRKKNCLGAAKWKKSLVIMEKKRNSFTLEKLLIYFFLQIKFAFRKDPLQIHNQQSLVKTDVKIQKQFQL